MKKITLFLMMPIFAVIASCGSQQQSHESEQKSPSPFSRKEFYGVMHVKPAITVGQPVEMQFTVYNGTDTVSTFLKWQTPFEPLLGKYLEIKNEQGEEAPYIGAMAKRIMPPPADAYIEIKPQDSLSVKVDILKGYALEKPGKYTINFTSSDLSGLKVDQPITFTYIGK